MVEANFARVRVLPISVIVVNGQQVVVVKGRKIHFQTTLSVAIIRILTAADIVDNSTAIAKSLECLA